MAGKRTFSAPLLRLDEWAGVLARIVAGLIIVATQMPALTGYVQARHQHFLGTSPLFWVILAAFGGVLSLRKQAWQRRLELGGAILPLLTLLVLVATSSTTFMGNLMYHHVVILQAIHGCAGFLFVAVAAWKRSPNAVLVCLSNFSWILWLGMYRSMMFPILY